MEVANAVFFFFDAGGTPPPPTVVALTTVIQIDSEPLDGAPVLTAAMVLGD